MDFTSTSLDRPQHFATCFADPNAKLKSFFNRRGKMSPNQYNQFLTVTNQKSSPCGMGPWSVLIEGKSMEASHDY